MMQRRGPWPSTLRRQAASTCRIIAVSAVPVLIVVAPLHFGAVGQTTLFVLLGTALVAAAALVGERALGEGDRSLRLGLPGLLGLAFTGLILFQLVPLPRPLLSVLSPAADRHYETTVPGHGGEADAILSLERAVLPDVGADAFPARMRTLSLDPHATLAALPRTLLCLLLFVLAASAGGGSMLRVVAVTLVVIATFDAGYGLIETLSGHQQIFAYVKTFDTSSVTGTYINRNHFAGLMELGLPAGLGLSLSLRRGRPTSGFSLREALVSLGSPGGAKILLIALACSIMAAGLLLSFSRAGILAGILGAILAVTLAGRRGRSSRRGLILFLVIAAAAIPAYVAGSARLLDRYRTIPVDIDTEGRFPVWKRTLEIAAEFPLTGTGHGTFASVFPAYRPPHTGFYDHAHNDYLQLLAEDGIPGFLLVVTALGTCVMVAWRARSGLARDQMDLSSGLLAGMAALMAHGMVDFNAQIPANAALFSAAAGAIYGSAIGQSRPAGAARPAAAAVLLAWLVFLSGLSWSVHGKEDAELRSLRADLPVEARGFEKTITSGLERLAGHVRGDFPSPEALALFSRYSLLDAQAIATAEPGSDAAGARVHEAYRAARRGMVLQPTRAEHFILAALALQTGEVFGHLLPGQRAGSVWTEALIERLLTRASLLDPRNPTHRKSIGEIYIARGRIDEGIEEYRASLEAGDEHMQEIFSAVWNLPGGESLIGRVLPPTIEATLGLAHFHGRAGRPRKAEELYREALLEGQPGQALAAATGLGRILLYEGRLVEAEAICGIVEARFPEEGDRLSFLRGQIAMASGRPSDAVEHLETALRASPRSTGVQWHLALALCASKDHQACIANMSRLLEEDNLSGGRELSARLLLGAALERQGRNRESLEQYLRVRILDPRNTQAEEAIRRLSGTAH